jgi:hypothetical protein
VTVVTIPDCISAFAPPDRVLRLSAVADTVYVEVCSYEEGHDAAAYRTLQSLRVDPSVLLRALATVLEGERLDALRPWVGPASDKEKSHAYGRAV